MPAKFVRSVSLTPELTALIDEKMATGHHRSASGVVRAALRLPAEQGHRADGIPHKRTTGGCDAR